MTKSSLIVIVITALVINLGSVGYFLYLWGSEGLPFSTSLWITFKTFFVIIIATVLVFTSIYYLKIKKSKNKL